MGFSIWDREQGGPATNKRYLNRRAAEKAVQTLSAGGNGGRFYIKAL